MARDQLSQSRQNETPIEPRPGQSLVVRTTTKDSYPTTAEAYFYCEVLDVSGEEVEGGEVIVTPTGEHLVALNLSGCLPPLGSQGIAQEVGGGWVFR